MAELSSPSLKRQRLSFSSARDDYPHKIREIAEESELNNEETERWRQTLHVDAEEQVKEDAQVEAKFSGLMRLEDLDERLRNVLAAITSKDPTDGLVEFKKLIQGEDGGKLLQQYVLLSAKCTEIMSVWSPGLNIAHAVPLLQLLSEIMRHPMGKEDSSNNVNASRQVLQVLRVRIDRLARSIISTKLKDIYAHLTSGEHRRQCVALLLMSSIIKRGSMLASEVASAFDFTLNVLPSLAKAPRSPKDKKGEPKQKNTARSAFVGFALSFLEVCHAALLRWILQIRPLYSGVLHRLASDDETTILTVLKVFRLRVLDSSGMVPPGLQSAIFGDSTLEQLAIISSNVSAPEAAQAAHDTLLQLCTDPAHGICPETSLLWETFPGKSGSFGGGQGRLVRLMIKLRATEIQNHRDLLLSIAARRPLLVAMYLESFPYSLEPRVSTAWFAAAALISDLLLVAKVLPPFEPLATQGLPPPAIDSSLFQGVLKSTLPRNLARVLINRGLLHASMLVKHGCLRMLLEILSAVEFYLNSINKARQSLQKKLTIGESSQISSETIMSEKLESFDVSMDCGKFESTHDSVQPRSKELVCCQKWLALEDYLKNELRSFSPDPQVLFSLISFKPLDIGGASDLKVKKTCSVKSTEVLELDEDLLEKGCLHVNGAGSPGWDPSKSRAEHSKDSMASLADIWNADPEIQAGDMENLEGFLNAKLLEVLAIYQRILPTALVESSLDVFKILPEDPTLLTLSQQKALLMLLKAVSGESFGQTLNFMSDIGLESLQVRHMYRHLKPLLKLTLSSKVGWIRKQAQSLARRALISSGAFESNKSEVEIWLHFLPSCDRSVLSFFCDAVETVGRNIDKYVDTLLSIIYSAANQDGFLASQFGPFVVCVIDKCLRVLTSSTKNLKISERTSIALYVANVLDILIQSQVNSKSLKIVINALLSSKVEENTSSFRSEWSPLQNLLSCGRSRWTGVNEVPPFFITAPPPQTFFSADSIAKVLKCCKIDEGSSVEAKAAALSSCLKCASLPVVVESLPMLMEIYFSVLKGKLPVLTDLFGAYKWLLSAVANVWPELFEKSLGIASNLAHLKKVSAEKTSMLGDSKQASTCAMNSKESQSPISSSDIASFAFSVFLLGIPFAIIFPCAANFNEAALLRSHQCQNVLELALSDIPPHLWLSTANLILFWIGELNSLHYQGSAVKCQVDVCFSLLKSLILPSESHGWFALLQTEENAVNLVTEFMRGALSHPILNTQFVSAKSSVCEASIQVEEKDFRGFEAPGLLEAWFHRGLHGLSLLECHIVNIFKELLQWAFEVTDKDFSAALLKVKQVILISSKAFLEEVVHAVKIVVLESQETRSGGVFPSVVTYLLFLFFRFIDIESMTDVSCTLISKELISQDVNGGDLLTSRMPYHVVGLYFAISTFKRFGLLLQQKDWQLNSVLWDSLLQNLYEKVIHVVLTKPSEMAFSCLLSALEAHCGYSSLTFDGWLHKSSVSVLSSYIHTTPLELMNHLMKPINKTKAKIILQLIQLQQSHLSEFSVVLGYNLGISRLPFSSLTSLVLGQPFSCSDDRKTQYTFKELLLLLPSVNWLINAITYKEHKSHFRIVKEILLVYSKVIIEITKDWDIFEADLDMPEVIPFLKSSESGEHFERFFVLTTPGQIIVMFKHCLTHDHFNAKEKAKLLSSVVKENSPLFDSHSSDVSKLSLESLLRLASVTIAQSMMAKLLVLSAANFKITKSRDNSLSALPEINCMETELVGEKSVQVAEVLISTLGVLFKLQGMDVQNTNDTLEISGFRVKISKLRILHSLEITLLKHLKDVMKTEAIIQHEAQFMSLLKKFTKLVLRFRFGEQFPMQVLRCYAFKLLQLPYLSRQYASYALDLLVGHSQFSSTLLSYVAVSKHNLVGGCCNGSLSSLQSLSSVLSVLKSPWRQDLAEKFSEREGFHDPEVLQGKSVQDRKLELIKFLRLLYFLKRQGSAVEVSNEQHLNSNELLSLLLGAYGASLSEIDREILLLMREMESFEATSCTGLKGMDYMWGEAALKLHQRNVKDVDGSILDKLSDEYTNKEVRKRYFKEDLMLSPLKCALGVLFFPVRRNLFDVATICAGAYEEEEKVHSITKSDERNFKNAAYDPCYMLPFALHNLSSGWISAEDFILKGLLALTLVSIASAEEDMRKLGYEILASFFTLLEEGSSFKGKPQIRLLLIYVKNSVLEPWQRLPFVTALFTAEASCILMNPSDVHYTAVNKFLFRAPGIDLEAIPLFKPMFGSGSIFFRADRTWILRLVFYSLRTSFDTHVYRRRFILEILMSFYGSPLGDKHTREWTLQILDRASKLRSLVQHLVEHAGLLSWLTLIIFTNSATKSGEYAGGMSIEFTLEALQIWENILMWRSVKRWLISEGFEELSKMVLLLHHHALQSLSSREPAMFLRHYLRILGTTFSLSRARKKFQSHLNFSLADFDGIIQLIEMERVPDHETRLLALTSILESQPPACISFQEKTFLHKFGTWALMVVLQDFCILPNYMEDNVNVKNGISESNSKVGSEDLTATVLRWLAASLVLGESEKRVIVKGSTTALTFFDKVSGMDGSASASESELNKDLAKLLVNLQCFLGRSAASAAMVSVLCACGSLLPLIDGPCGIFFKKFWDVVQLPLQQLSCPLEVDTSWQWKWLNNTEVDTSFDHEICQILFTLFQKLLYVKQNSELHNIVEMLHLSLRDYIASKGGTCDSTCSMYQLWMEFRTIFNSSDDVIQGHT